MQLRIVFPVEPCGHEIWMARMLHRLLSRSRNDDSTGHGQNLGLILISKLVDKLSDEEEVMRKQFPDQYAAYREQVKRIIPFIH